MNGYYRWLPLAIFGVISVSLLGQLLRNSRGETPQYLESALVGKTLPTLPFQSLADPTRTVPRTRVLNGEPFLLNIWATWCPTCRAEHRYLNQLAEQGVRVIGLNYKDDPVAARAWLAGLGDPYTLNLSDGDGKWGLELGVYGAPETFLIDGSGVIRYRHTGDLTPGVWVREFQDRWGELHRGEGP